ncbi:MAG: hypothetical protein IPG71_09935 [bacterium]|nr:hypothetical protein [bacterium]
MSYVAALLVCSLTAFAQSTQPDALMGARPGAFSARSLGLGHSYLTRDAGSAALMGNPALLADQQDDWNLNATVDLSRVRETRSYPFYDAFDGVLGYNNYALNDHVYSKLNGGAAYRLKQDHLDVIVLSAGTYSAYQFDYTYHEEVRNRFTSGGVQDKVLGRNLLEVSGDLRAIALGAAASQGKMSMGFSLSFLTGEWGYVNGVYFASDDSSDRVMRTDFALDGTPADINFGGSFDLSPRVRLGTRLLFPAGELKYESTNTMLVGSSSTEFNQTSTVQYPSHIALGVQYRPQNEFRPELYFESELHTYSEIADEFNDALEFRAGAEQQIVPGTPARFGIVYSTSPTDKDRAATLFSAGVGFVLRNMRADFGLEFGEINYAADDLFQQSIYGDDNRTDRDHVETSVFRGMIELSWGL